MLIWTLADYYDNAIGSRAIAAATRIIGVDTFLAIKIITLARYDISDNADASCLLFGGSILIAADTFYIVHRLLYFAQMIVSRCLL